jgi:HEAT repeat protein
MVNIKPNDRRADVARKLVVLTKDESPFIQWPAIQALGTWGSKAEVPALIEATIDKNPSTRREAFKVIGRFRDDRTVVPVMNGLRDNSTRGEAGQALRDLGPMAEPEVLAVLAEPRELGLLSLKQAAIDVLADIGSEKSVPALRKIAASTDFHEKARLVEPAQKALAAIEKRKKP